MKKEERRDQLVLTAWVTVFVFVVLLAAIMVGVLLVYLMAVTGVITSESWRETGLIDVIILMNLISLVIGLLLSGLSGNLVMKPVNLLVKQMNRLASGDYSARLDYGTYVGPGSTYSKVEESFNKMAQELENSEMLRSDFVNNFSHEFKTPIVSIAGFAKLLNRGNLTPEQQREYLAVIEEESLRLSYMATNVLNLSRVENQAILTDVTEFNLSEQIRSCVLLLENKWAQKNLELLLEFGEHMVRANEELLKQVWINLLDNAIKFTPDGHTVEVRIREHGDRLEVVVRNTGTNITPEQQAKIWRKFYQADESHATKGNGVGLAIVKRITELHGGRAEVSSGNDVTAFTITLPK